MAREHRRAPPAGGEVAQPHVEGPHVFVVDALHEHQFPVRPLGVRLVLEWPTELLYCHVPLQDVIICRAGGGGQKGGMLGTKKKKIGRTRGGVCPATFIFGLRS